MADKLRYAACDRQQNPFTAAIECVGTITMHSTRRAGQICLDACGRGTHQGIARAQYAMIAERHARPQQACIDHILAVQLFDQMPCLYSRL